MNMKRLLSVATVVVSLAPLLMAQAVPDYSAICKSQGSDIGTAYCPELQKEFATNKSFETVYPPNGALINLLNDQVGFVAATQRAAYLALLEQKAQADLQGEVNTVAQWVSSRYANSQPGAGANSSGSTSLVSKPTTTDLISLAAESGAFTDTQNGTTLTAQANLDGLKRYLSNQNFAPVVKTGLGEDLLRHSTINATFEVAQSGSTTATTTGNATSSTPAGLLNVIVPSNNLTFESIGGSLQIYRRYTPNSSKFQAAWKKAFSAYLASTQGKVYSQYVTDVNALNSLNELADTKSSLSKASNDWQAAAKAAEIKNDFPSFVAAFAKYANTYISEVKSNDKTFDQDVVNAYSDITAIQSAESSVIDQARGLLATVTYSYSTPPGKPATHDASAVASYVWIKKDAGAQITGNFGGSWFVSVPAGASYGHVKDYQFSAEFDQPLPASSANPRATLSFAGYGQYQYSANVLNVTISNLAPGTNITVPSNSQVFTSTPGWLGIAQAKLTFKIGTAASIPVAFKWSNKTDLLDTPDWKGQFGISYDLSALKSILAPKSGN